MKQLLLSLENGQTTLEEVPVPGPSSTAIVVETRNTVVSAGTERMLVEFGHANLLAKARSQPEKVRQVLDRMRTDGVASTLEAVRAKLSAPVPLGYCQAGIVAAVGSPAGRFRVGDRVVTNGSHAEYVRVPELLTARIPDNVSFEAACFTPVAAIGLQGIRHAQPTLGETVVVFGLGLIGLLTVQLLRAQGCRVIGIDVNPSRLALAATLGAISFDGDTGDPVERVMAVTAGVGADAVLLTLATDADEPIRQAARMTRKRGRIVLVGVTGLSLSREDFYKRELSFTVSASYGPGRYDPAYEEQGRDYPLPFVRWTAQRNFEAVLTLMSEGRLQPEPLISHRFEFVDAPAAYRVVTGGEPSLGVVLAYPEQGGAARSAGQRTVVRHARSGSKNGAAVGVIGSGNFAVRTLLPALRAARVKVRSIASAGGVSAAVAATAADADIVTSDADVVFGDPEIGSVFVLTRHDSHARYALQALRAGKHVFVEKPLALAQDDLDAIAEAAVGADRLVMVGFNRRFAPLTLELQRELRGRAGPLSVIATINAGAIPREHWTQDWTASGGRIAGEACHWIDLARALVGAPIADLQVTTARNASGEAIDDITHLSLRFDDGSTAVVHYLASGPRSFPKERIECFFDGKMVAIDNWRRLRRYGVPRPLFELSGKADKGHAAEIIRWMQAVRGEAAAPIPLAELLEVSSWSLRAAALARSGHATVAPI